MHGMPVQMRDGWVWLELTDEEVDKCVDDVLKLNTKIYTKCLGEASKMVATMPNTVIANSLFEKSGMALFTVLENTLKKKRNDLLNPKKPAAVNTMPTEVVKKVEEKACVGFSKATDFKQPSMIDKVFEEIDDKRRSDT